MTNTSTTNAPAATPTVEVQFSVGQVFRFAGLSGQEGFTQRLPGSGSVGWLMEVVGVSPWGNLALSIDPEEPTASSHTFTIGMADAVEMVRQGCWQHVTNE